MSKLVRSLTNLAAGADVVVDAGGKLTAVTARAGTIVAEGYVANDQAITASYADATGLSFAVAASTDYQFDFMLAIAADAVTTGIDVAVNGPASPTLVVYEQKYWITASAATEAFANAYDANTASTDSNGTTVKWFRVKGLLRNGTTAGNLAVRVKRENVGSGTLKAGSYGILIKV